jgi:hypothetical protein
MALLRLNTPWSLPRGFLLFRGKSFVIDKKSQQKIANWAMKTILVVNHNNPAPPAGPFIPQAH